MLGIASYMYSVAKSLGDPKPAGKATSTDKKAAATKPIKDASAKAVPVEKGDNRASQRAAKRFQTQCDYLPGSMGVAKVCKQVPVAKSDLENGLEELVALEQAALSGEIDLDPNQALEAYKRVAAVQQNPEGPFRSEYVQQVTEASNALRTLSTITLKRPSRNNPTKSYTFKSPHIRKTRQSLVDGLANTDGQKIKQGTFRTKVLKRVADHFLRLRAEVSRLLQYYNGKHAAIGKLDLTQLPLAFDYSKGDVDSLNHLQLNKLAHIQLYRTLARLERNQNLPDDKRWSKALDAALKVMGGSGIDGLLEADNMDFEKLAAETDKAEATLDRAQLGRFHSLIKIKSLDEAMKFHQDRLKHPEHFKAYHNQLRVMKALELLKQLKTGGKLPSDEKQRQQISNQLLKELESQQKRLKTLRDKVVRGHMQFSLRYNILATWEKDSVPNGRDNLNAGIKLERMLHRQIMANQRLIDDLKEAPIADQFEYNRVAKGLQASTQLSLRTDVAWFVNNRLYRSHHKNAHSMNIVGKDLYKGLQAMLIGMKSLNQAISSGDASGVIQAANIVVSHESEALLKDQLEQDRKLFQNIKNDIKDEDISLVSINEMIAHNEKAIIALAKGDLKSALALHSAYTSIGRYQRVLDQYGLANKVKGLRRLIVSTPFILVSAGAAGAFEAFALRAGLSPMMTNAISGLIVSAGTEGGLALADGRSFSPWNVVKGLPIDMLQFRLISSALKSGQSVPKALALQVTDSVGVRGTKRFLLSMYRLLHPVGVSLAVGTVQDLAVQLSEGRLDLTQPFSFENIYMNAIQAWGQGAGSLGGSRAVKKIDLIRKQREANGPSDDWTFKTGFLAPFNWVHKQIKGAADALNIGLTPTLSAPSGSLLDGPMLMLADTLDIPAPKLQKDANAATDAANKEGSSKKRLRVHDIEVALTSLSARSAGEISHSSDGSGSKTDFIVNIPRDDVASGIVQQLRQLGIRLKENPSIPGRYETTLTGGDKISINFKVPKGSDVIPVSKDNAQPAKDDNSVEAILARHKKQMAEDRKQMAERKAARKQRREAAAKEKKTERATEQMLWGLNYAQVFIAYFQNPFVRARLKQASVDSPHARDFAQKLDRLESAVKDYMEAYYRGDDLKLPALQTKLKDISRMRRELADHLYNIGFEKPYQGLINQARNAIQPLLHNISVGMVRLNSTLTGPDKAKMNVAVEYHQPHELGETKANGFRNVKLEDVIAAVNVNVPNRATLDALLSGKEAKDAFPGYPGLKGLLGNGVTAVHTYGNGSLTTVDIKLSSELRIRVNIRVSGQAPRQKATGTDG